jgi:glycosyltransferase involved in cell wall biosynthesis
MRFVSRSIADYDLLITHNAVFGEATSAVRLAHEAGVPSVFIPHLHYDDDFYHFPDIVKACETATVTLVAPSALTNYFRSKGMNNIQDHGPGVDANIPFTSEDSAVFRRVLGRDDDFVLVLGRKAAAKGYREVIAAAERSQQSPLVVLIGPDDDGKEISSEGAIYLGPQPDQVVRGALRECLALVNMSRSESFGMVLIEAGLAGKPVLANRACAAFCDLVEHGENGFLVDMGDLQDHLDTIVANPQLRQALGEEGRIRALAHDWRKVEEDFITMCNNLVTKQ